jgi:hypothetical protein
MKRILGTAGILFALALAWGSPANNNIPQARSPHGEPTSNAPDLSELTKRGLSYRFLDDRTIEIKEGGSGLTQIKTLREPSEIEIRAWVGTQGIPILEIDPSLIDTSKYTGWYAHWTELPLSNGLLAPLVVADVNRNGKPDVYGIFMEFSGGGRDASL